MKPLFCSFNNLHISFDILAKNIIIIPNNLPGFKSVKIENSLPYKHPSKANICVKKLSVEVHVNASFLKLD